MFSVSFIELSQQHFSHHKSTGTGLRFRWSIGWFNASETTTTTKGMTWKSGWTSTFYFANNYDLLRWAQILEERDAILSTEINEFDMFYAVVKENTWKKSKWKQALNTYMLNGLWTGRPFNQSFLLYLCTWDWHSNGPYWDSPIWFSVDRLVHISLRLCEPPGLIVHAMLAGSKRSLQRNEPQVDFHEAITNLWKGKRNRNTLTSFIQVWSVLWQNC